METVITRAERFDNSVCERSVELDEDILHILIERDRIALYNPYCYDSVVSAWRDVQV